MAERAGERVEDGGTALKRRGILAAAGAAVAGIMAKQAAQPVAAGGTDHQPLVISEANTSTGGTILTYSGATVTYGAALWVTDPGTASTFSAMVGGIATGGKAENGVYGESLNGAGVKGLSTGGYPGVHGKSTFGAGIFGESTSGSGVSATSTYAYAIQGVTSAGAGANFAGVLGGSSGDGNNGVYGYNTGAGGVGVYGEGDAATSIGVQGQSTSGYPVVGKMLGAGGATNTHAAVTGFGTAGPGVQGQSTGGYGLVGFTDAPDGHSALIGYANKAGGIGLIGNAPGGASPGLAGVFNGDVIVNGALRVYGSPKNAAVTHPTDGTHRLLYCEESPESWFADYGEGTLANGRADIKLDPDFAVLVHTEQYHVFLTEYEDNSGLYVTKRGAAGFTVQAKEVAAPGGPKAPTKQAGGTFSWRVVAKRKDISGERLAKVAPPPPLKPVTAFTVPETPTPKPPTKP